MGVSVVSAQVCNNRPKISGVSEQEADLCGDGLCKNPMSSSQSGMELGSCEFLGKPVLVSSRSPGFVCQTQQWEITNTFLGWLM